MSARTAVILGGVLLGLGLLLAFGSFYYNARVMGKAALGVGVYAPEPGSPEWRQKELQRRISDGLFVLGVLLSLAGVILQTYGSAASV